VEGYAASQPVAVLQQAQQAAAPPSHARPLLRELQVERMKERLLEWELERFGRLCMKMKKTLLHKSRDPANASLATIPGIPSVSNLRLMLQQEQERRHAGGALLLRLLALLVQKYTH